ncbi:MAG: PSD1 and planctomycete cytochrome C domain-containing protein [Planctomycetaceae bacterium]
MQKVPLLAILILLFSNPFLFADEKQFEEQVRPLLIDHCLKCHGPEKQSGNLRLDTKAAILQGGDSGPALVPGKPSESLLWQRIESGEMPPATEPRLNAKQKAALEKWLRDGAAMTDRALTLAEARDWRRHWAFQRPSREKALASLPSDIAKQVEAGLHPIDAFIDTKLAENKLSTAPKASKQTLIRRAYFDLLGLPPTPEQVAAFVNDNSPQAWESLLTQLLSSPQYGERWGRHWLDVARYADSGGYETDIYYRNAWRYRDYVVKSFNDDKPYNLFVQEQIAGDEIWPDDIALAGNYTIAPEKMRHLEALTATGFYTLGPQIHESNMDGKKLRSETISDWVDTTGAAFLGLTLGCARCHDHKFDPLSQHDYYAMQAIFARSKEVEVPIIDAMGIADFKQHYPRILAIDAARSALRQFDSQTAGRPLTPDEQNRRLQLLQNIATGVLALPEKTALGASFTGLMEIPTISVLGHERPELVAPIHRLNRGELDQPREEVSPALPTSLAEATEISAAVSAGLTSRKELALWLTRADHPLTARVMVNRVWQWHFGRGIVATPSDFGKMGQAPTHPELLDWLATEFTTKGWNIKQLHRLIMTSNAYQRASDFATDAHLQADPDNRLLWRFQRCRLEGEAVWDSLHAVAGTLNLQMGGPPVMPPLADEELASLRDRYRWIVTPDPKQHTRRGLYVVNFRNYRFPLFEVFDAPNNSVSAPGRDVSTVAPQSLWMLNNKTVWQQAKHLAARTVKETDKQPAPMVTRLFQITLGREPSPQELSEALSLLEELPKSSEAKPLETLPAELQALPPEKALALTKLALLLLNHNEFLFID